MAIVANKIYNMDCVEGLKQIKDNSIDMIFADPPFNVGKKYGKDSTKDKRKDYYSWCEEWIEEGFRVLQDTGTFYLMTLDRHLEKKFPMMGARGVFINLVKWRNVSAAHDKRRFWGSTQPILVYGKTDNYLFNTYAVTRKIAVENQRWGGYSTAPKGQYLDYWDDIPFIYAGSIHHEEAIMEPGTNSKAHPAQMPVGLAERAIRFSTNDDAIVLDPFMGTGSTAVAAIRSGRRFIGFEKDKKYFDDAVIRINKAKEQGKISEWF